MSKFCIAEIVVLLIGWLSNFLFLLYSAGIFEDGRFSMPTDANFRDFAAILAMPYLLTFLSCYVLRRFVKAFLLLSLVLTIGSTCAYYIAYVGETPPDPYWIFVMVPYVQTAVAIAFALLAFVFGLVVKHKPTVAAA